MRGHQHRIREQADRLLDAVEAGGQPGELVGGFTEPFPLLVMCDLVGIPYAERERFVPLADAPFNVQLGLDNARRATALVHEYATELIERKRREPTEDILSDLVRQQEAGELTDEDVTTFGLSMLLIGHRTSAVFLTNAVLLLLTEPEQFLGVRAAGEVSSSAVEELLRYLPVMNAEVILQAIGTAGADGLVEPIPPTASRRPRARVTLGGRLAQQVTDLAARTLVSTPPPEKYLRCPCPQRAVTTDRLRRTDTDENRNL
ncbi:MAG: hypothetical protein ACRDRS_07970 [Pseudonocardiaceae bacterium]